MNKRSLHFLLFAIPALVCMLALDGCHTYDNATTYFNTYYNAKRLMTEVEDEFEFTEEKKRIKPRILVAEKSTLLEEPKLNDTPPFLQEFIISQEKLQPVRTKVDSIITKGSKILAKHPKSNYVDGSLFLMAKSYFIESDWQSSQVKCQELIDAFPYSSFSPAGHLYLAKDHLLQREYETGLKVLSRTVDIAWGQKDYDVLSEAFRLQAELALYRNDIDGALKPYRRAIAQTDDDEMRARWQVEAASILFRKNDFEGAAREFRKVGEYSPDLLASFESQLYLGASLAQTGKYDEAGKIFNELERNENYKEWRSYTYAQRMIMLRLQDKMQDLEMAEKQADSAFIGSPAIGTVYYLRGLDSFKKGDYNSARQYFAQAKLIRSPIFLIAGRYSQLLNLLEDKSLYVTPFLSAQDGKQESDSLRGKIAGALFDIARIHEQLGNRDSSLVYYEKAIGISPGYSTQRAKYLYVLATSLAAKDSARADSLLDEIVQRYPLTEYATESRVKLGYTQALVVDSVAELYTSANSFKKVGEYRLAARQYARLAELYPESGLAPRSLYTAGWVFERDLLNNDSALYYYRKLIEKYPTSEYAIDIRPSVLYAQSAHNNGPDTAQQQGTVPSKGDIPPIDTSTGANHSLRPNNTVSPTQAKPSDIPPSDERIPPPRPVRNGPIQALPPGFVIPTVPAQQPAQTTPSGQGGPNTQPAKPDTVRTKPPVAPEPSTGPRDTTKAKTKP